jgi:type I restriction enzyme M protein
MNTDTKRHIDSARQVLVGVVPNPTSQIDQITNALIYKFMDDMDQAAIKQGDEPSFFVGDLELYAWTRLMDPRMGNQERMNLYSEALIKFSQAKQLPELFRGIFKSAFLPYRSPETLGLFLKEINYFDYSHPEELGNAYEYLLSIMSSQGDAGQFRTPRHIIDFIVDVVNPTKDDKVLDPACGTGGFLVSSYTHILEQHDGKDDSEKKEKPLTPDERKKLMANFEGYDIDPTMVRIAQVNMYLHQFKNPKIYQYDSLSSEERWNDKFDVILANPPFMSPKGGIKPHSKFSILSNRSEVLFVDYIMNHLRPKGRAGIIVPEGIIFQSGTSHKDLRKNLVNDGLYAVVSLPSGVFAPYSGVKTSILLFNTELAKTNTEILFVKIEQDGFDLGATKRQISKNDLPVALEIINKWNNAEKVENKLAVYVEKSKIAENGDYNLSVDHYRITTDYNNAKWPMVELGDVCDVAAGNSAPQEKELFEDGKYPFFRTSDVGAVHLSDNLREVRDWLNDKGIIGLKLSKKGTILFPKSGASTFLNHRVIMGFDGYVSSHLATITPKDGLINSKYIYQLLIDIDAKSLTPDQAYPSLKTSEIAKIKIPLPPLEIQEQIVVELDGYTGIIVGAKQIVQNWKPKIDIDPEWEMVKLETIVEILDSKRRPITKSDRIAGEYPYYGATGILDYVADFIFNERLVLLGEDGAKWESGDQTAFIAEGKYWVNNHAHVLRPRSDKLVDIFLVTYLNQIDLLSYVTGVTVPKLNQEKMRSIEIPLPSVEIQNQIVKNIEAERSLVESAKKLICIYEKKTKETIAKLWEK